MVPRRYPVLFLVVTALLLGACNKPVPSSTVPVVDTATSTDTVPIRYETVGKGDVALVFVHCWTCNRGFWDAQVAPFAQQYQVVRLDLAGHGESGNDRKIYSMAAFGADVAAVADKLKLKKIVLIGHSMGGPVSLEAEKRLGDRVIGVVGVDTFHTGFTIPTGAKAKKFSNDFVKPFEQNFPEHAGKLMRSFFAAGADPLLVDRVAKNTQSADKAMALSAMRQLFAWYEKDAAVAFQRIDGRLRNINGDPKGENKPLHPSVTLIAGAAHFPAQEKPAEFNQALDTIIKQFVAGAAKK